MEDIKEKTADEMFEELGYEKKYEGTYKREKQELVFYSDLREVAIYKKDENGLGIDFIDMQELQAINKKCKELRLVRR